MKPIQYFLFCLIYLITSIVIILFFHSDDFFKGNEMQQAKFISMSFYVIYSFRIFMYILPLLFYKQNNKKIFIYMPLLFGSLMFIRIIFTQYNGTINVHLRNLEIVLEVMFIFLYIFIIVILKWFLNKKNDADKI